MANITLRGSPLHTIGELPPLGGKAPDFKLVNSELQDVNLASFRGKRKILNIVPSLDTPVCATSTRHFNQDAASLPNTVVLVISDDLPFAAKRFCVAEGIDKVYTLSEMRHREFGEAYGVRITDGPLAGLLSRAVVVIDEHDKVTYIEQVPEIAQEPDYAKALAAAK